MNNIYHYMDAIGNGKGVKSFNGNYSDAGDGAIKARHNVPANEVHEIHRLIVAIEDGQGIKAETYGAMAALTNGITIHAEDDNSVLLDLTDDVPIKTNSQWGMLCYDVNAKAWGNGNDMLLARFSFDRAGQPLIIHGHPENNRRLSVNLHDDMSGLVAHRFMLQGKRFNLDGYVNKYL